MSQFCLLGLGVLFVFSETGSFYVPLAVLELTVYSSLELTEIHLLLLGLKVYAIIHAESLFLRLAILYFWVWALSILS